MKTSVKKVFESENWIITKVMQGRGGKVRVDAKRRFPVADESSFFSEWCSKRYADNLSRERFGKKTNELRAWEY